MSYWYYYFFTHNLLIYTCIYVNEFSFKQLGKKLSYEKIREKGKVPQNLILFLPKKVVLQNLWGKIPTAVSVYYFLDYMYKFKNIL